MCVTFWAFLAFCVSFWASILKFLGQRIILQLKKSSYLKALKNVSEFLQNIAIVSYKICLLNFVEIGIVYRQLFTFEFSDNLNILATFVTIEINIFRNIMLIILFPNLDLACVLHFRHLNPCLNFWDSDLF